jgi:LacI family transcriptional regulator
MATIKDVSAYTRLALGTISKYLNGGYVRPENKILLDQAVLALDYRVNQVARNLKQNY